MIMRAASRAIILKQNNLLVMHRNKFGQEYDILIGGGIEIGETPEQALMREISEESGVSVGQPRLVFVERAPAPYGTQYVFLCSYISGKPRLDENAIEYKIDMMGTNRYMPVWRTLEELKVAQFRSLSLKKAILKGLSEGFPKQPIDITNT